MARALDLLVIALYMTGMAAIGLYFRKRQTSTESFFIASRGVPSWAMGLSMLATLISSVTFVAYPGSSYAKDWSLLVPGFMVIATLILVASVIIPFYRREVRMSAYEYFESRFGRPVRLYASFAFSLAHFSKMGFVFYLMGLTISSITGWSVDLVILLTGVVMIFYTITGGMEAVIWTDVVQAFVCWIGVAFILGYLLFLPPGGPSAVFQLAAANHKFSLGSTAFDLSRPTIPVLLLYGFFWYLQRYVADQTVVQRYLVAKSDRSAIRGVLLGACMTVPVWTLFMLIGTATWAFYKLTNLPIPSHITKTDQIFPYFVSSQLPAGVAGLFMASLIGAAMTMLASDLNCMATVGVEDFYRSWKKDSSDGERLAAGKRLVAVVGGLAAVTALVLAHTQGSALSMWFAVSAIASGGLCGLFLLAFLSQRANRQGAWAGIAASAVCTVWAVLTKGAHPIVNLGAWNFPWDDLMIGAVGHAVLLAVGYAGSLLTAERPAPAGSPARS